MKKTFTTIFLLQILFHAVSQDNSVSSYCYGHNSGVWVQLDEVLAGISYLGNSERIELELSGGNYAAFGRVTYFIDARGGLQVSAMQVNQSVAGHELVIYDNGAATNSNNKYIIGIRIPAGPWTSICIRARELKSQRWLNITPTSEPQLQEVTPTVTWINSSAPNGHFKVDGSLGIGTSSPEARLDIRSNGKAVKIGETGNNDNFYLQHPFSSSAGYKRFVIGGNLWWENNLWNYGASGSNGFNAVMGRSNAGLGFYTKASSHTSTGGTLSTSDLENNYLRMVIMYNGNVGIGESNPDSKLVVDGRIRSEEVKVEIINGPDYVFETDYELRTLQETKQYIQENKHLPEIPSAKEMEANGVDLGDMNMRLLKKIEELTLYQIQLLEKLEHQNEQLLEQQNRIEKLESRGK